MDKEKRRWVIIAITLLSTLFLTTWGPWYAPNVFAGQEGLLWFMAIGYIGYDLYHIWRERQTKQKNSDV